MDIVWVIIAVGVSSAVGYALRPRGTKQRKFPTDAPAWEEVARQHGLRFSGTTIAGQYGGHEVMVSLVTRVVERRRRKQYIVQTHYVVSIAGLPEVGVTHTKDEPIDPTAEPVRGEMQEVSIGNHAFDAAFFTYAPDAAAVEFLHRRGVAETIIELRDREYVIELRDGELHALRTEFVDDAEDLIADLDEIVAAANVLQGDAHPGTFTSDPHIERWYWAEQRGLEYDTTNCMIHGAVDGRDVKIHFGQRAPLTVVEASTARDLGIRTRAPIPAHLAIPQDAREAADRVAENGDEVHFLEVVRIRADRPLPFDEIERRLDAMLRAAAHVEG